MDFYINLKVNFRGNSKNFLLSGSETKSWESMEAMVREIDREEVVVGSTGPALRQHRPQRTVSPQVLPPRCRSHAGDCD